MNESELKNFVASVINSVDGSFAKTIKPITQKELVLRFINIQGVIVGGRDMDERSAKNINALLDKITVVIEESRST